MRLNPEPLIAEAEIQARIAALAAEVSRDYAGRAPVLVGVLKGALHLTSDLARAMECPVEIEFIRASSYSGTASRNCVEISGADLACLAGRHVLVVEDILDTGQTLTRLNAYLESLGLASLRILTLLDKPSRRVAPVTADYVGFVIEDHFVVGYGLDYNERYRELRAIHLLEG
jgi:hypoxanthine phosphoribosyltransferase